MVSDSFLPGERNLLLPLSRQQYCTEGSSRPVTLPLRILRRVPEPERRPASEGAWVLWCAERGSREPNVLEETTAGVVSA